MPTLKPRVQVTLEPFTHEVIQRFAALQKRTRGSVIAELLDSIAPSLSRSIALLEAAQQAPKEIRDGLRNLVDGLHGEIVAATGDASHAISEFEALLGASGEGSTPVSVTRGSGTDTTPSQGAPKNSSKGSKSRVSKQ